MPSLRSKFTGFLKYFGPKASEEQPTASPSASPLAGSTACGAGAGGDRFEAGYIGGSVMTKGRLIIHDWKGELMIVGSRNPNAGYPPWDPQPSSWSSPTSEPTYGLRASLGTGISEKVLVTNNATGQQEEIPFLDPILCQYLSNSNLSNSTSGVPLGFGGLSNVVLTALPIGTSPSPSATPTPSTTSSPTATTTVIPSPEIITTATPTASPSSAIPSATPTSSPTTNNIDQSPLKVSYRNYPGATLYQSDVIKICRYSSVGAYTEDVPLCGGEIYEYDKKPLYRYSNNSVTSLALVPPAPGIYKLNGTWDDSLSDFNRAGSISATINITNLFFKLYKPDNDHPQPANSNEFTQNELSLNANDPKTLNIQRKIKSDFGSGVEEKFIGDNSFHNGDFNTTTHPDREIGSFKVTAHSISGQTFPQEVKLTYTDINNTSHDLRLTDNSPQEIPSINQELNFKLQANQQGKFSLSFENINTNVNFASKSITVKVEGQGETSTNGCIYYEQTSEQQLYQNEPTANSQSTNQQSFNSSNNLNPLAKFLKINQAQAEESNQTSHSQESGICQVWTSPNANQIDKDLYYSTDYLSHESNKIVKLNVKYKTKKSNGKIIIKSSVPIGTPGSDRSLINNVSVLAGGSPGPENVSGDGKLISASFRDAQQDSDVLYEYHLVTGSRTLNDLPNELNLQVYVLAEGETIEDVTPQNLNFKITKIAKPEIKVLSIDTIDYYNADGSVNSEVKAYPGSEVIYQLKYTHPANNNRNLADFYLNLQLPQFASVSSHEIELTNQMIATNSASYDGFNYDSANHLASFHFNREFLQLPPGQSYDATLRVKYDEEIPFKVTINDQEKPVKTFNVQAHLKKEFSNTSGLNIKFYSQENKLNIWQILKGKITGPYGHEVPGLDIALATVQNSTNASQANERIGGDVVISGIDVHNITSQDESGAGRNIVISDKEGNYNTSFNRNKLANQKLKLILYFRNVLNEQTVRGETSHFTTVKLFKPTYIGTNEELLYWKVPINLLGNPPTPAEILGAEDSPTVTAINAKQKIVTQNIDIYRKDNGWASSPKPEYPRPENEPDLFKQAAISAENQYWLINAIKTYNDFGFNLSQDINSYPVLNIVYSNENDPRWAGRFSIRYGTIKLNSESWQIYPEYYPHVLLHELSHYIQFKLMGFSRYEWDSNTSNHGGYANPSSSDSYTEGFAYFFPLYLYNVINYGDNVYAYDSVLHYYNGRVYRIVGTRFLPTFFDANGLLNSGQGVVKKFEDRAIAQFMFRLVRGSRDGYRVSNNALPWINSHDREEFVIDIPQNNDFVLVRNNVRLLLEKMQETFAYPLPTDVAGPPTVVRTQNISHLYYLLKNY